MVIFGSGANDPDRAAAVLIAVQDVMQGPFVWGAGDCCTSACDVFARLYGIDPMAPLRGRYASESQAMAMIRARGGWRRMTAQLADLAGLLPGVGGAGEIGLIKLPAGFALGVGVGGGQWAGRVDGGYQTVGNVVRSWQNS